MSNMPYCRFRNTLEDLRDCNDYLDTDEELSVEEERARRRLVKLCTQIAANYGEDYEEQADFPANAL